MRSLFFCELWSLVKWIIVVQHSWVFLELKSVACNLFSTLQLGLCLQDGDRITWHRISVISIGWRSLKGYSFVYVSLYIVVCMELLHHICLLHSIWQLTLTDVSVHLRLSHFLSHQLVAQHLVIVLFRWLQPEHGTHYLSLLDTHHPSPSSVVNSKQYYLIDRSHLSHNF